LSEVVVPQEEEEDSTV